MATNTSDFYTYSKTSGSSKNLQKPLDGGDNNVWGTYINTDLDTVVAAVNAISNLIADANENELIDFTATGSAVNHIQVTNAASGNPPQIASAGDDTNIDLTLAAKGTGDVNLTPGSTGDVNIPINKGITFGDVGEKVEGDGTDLTVSSSNDLNLTATTDINIPQDVGLTFGNDGEKIEGNATKLDIAAAEIDFSIEGSGDINIPANIGLTFASDKNDKIESNDTDLTVNSAGDINLTAGNDVNLPAQVGLTFGADTEKLEADASNNMTLSAAGDITLSADGDNINFNDGTTSRFELGLDTGDVTMTDTDGGGGIGPELKLSREGGTQVATDVIGGVTFAGQDDGENTTNYSRIQTVVRVVTDGSEDGELEIWTMNSGTLTKQFVIDSNGTFLLPSGTLTIGATS